MIVYVLDAKIINIYNGIGKDVIIVNNQELNKEFATRRVICSKTLEVTETGVMDISIGGIKYTGLKNSNKIHPFEGYDKYDVIIVTQEYARAARNQSMFNEDTLLMDYVDRLYYLNNCNFISDLEEEDSALEVRELNKVINSNGFYYYTQQIEKGGKLSLVAMLQCLQAYKDKYSTLDKVVRCYVAEFEQKVQDVIMERIEKLRNNNF